MRFTRPAAALAAATLLLTACGSASDQDKLTSIIKDGGKDPATICDHLSPALLRSFGTVKQCKTRAKAADDGKDAVKVKSIVVDGDAATAMIVGSQGNQTVSFAKAKGAWLVTAIK